MANLQRRNFIKSAISTAGALALPLNASAAPQKTQHRRDWRAVVLDRDRWLHLYRPATKETVKVCYYRKGKGWQKRQYLALCHILRDVEYKKAKRIDPKLLDLLYIIQSYLIAKKKPYVIHITSGYRTPEHNAALKGAASNSLHMQGKAADIFVPGIEVSALSRLVKAIGVGGVGIYPRRKFVHVDVGNFRSWVGDLFSPEPKFYLEGYGELFAGESLPWDVAA